MAVKKTAAAKIVKKTTTKSKPARSAPSKKVAESSHNGTQTDDLVGVVIAAIKGGEFDGSLDDLDTALTSRINYAVKKNADDAKKTTAPSTTAKKVSAPPVKSKPAAANVAAKVKPEEGKSYLVVKTNPVAGGARVKFLRHKVENGKQNVFKSVVEMLTDKAGKPKGTKVVLATNMLEPVPATPAKKTAAKTTKKVAAKKVAAKK